MDRLRGRDGGRVISMVRAIFGEIKFSGRLPVTVVNYPAGYSLKR